MKKKNHDKLLYVNFKLKALGLPGIDNLEKHEDYALIDTFFDDEVEKRGAEHRILCPVDQKIQDFIDTTFQEFPNSAQLKLPETVFELDQEGIASLVSLPLDKNVFESDLVKSYRTLQGALHNNRNDRRTTKGVFHISEGGLPIAQDKKTVPQATFAALFERALNPPDDILELPLTHSQENKARTFVSLLLRPMVLPEVPGLHPAKRSSIRFLAPGGLVSNLNFVESVFGNAGNPFLTRNDPALNVDEASGCYGLVLLAPHLNKVTKKEVGLPKWEDTTEKQRAQGMAWKDETERYNDGGAFKITFRNEKGVVITIIADNYFGYCKKEVKTQISFAANLVGLTEEEHAGGSLTFPSYNWGKEFRQTSVVCEPGEYNFKEALALLEADYDMQPEGYAIDKNFKNLYYVPEDAVFKLEKLKVKWEVEGEKRSIKLAPNITYMHPSGYKVRLEKHPASNIWYLVGTIAEGVFCHKPATVSGGGKSEISKPIADIIIYKNFYVEDLKSDLDQVEAILNKNFGDRFKDSKLNFGDKSRPILSKERSLGSVIKLLTPSEEHTEEYKAWLASIPPRILNLVYSVKRFYKKEWGENWREHFSVDNHDGIPGNDLKFDHQELNVRYLRVGLDTQKNWKTFRLRQDFIPSEKVQMEDDITASVVYPLGHVSGVKAGVKDKSYKFAQNCERMLFQRPDDAVFRGLDKITEADFSEGNLFASNYEPLTRETAQAILDDVIHFDEYSKPMQETIKQAAQMEDDEYFVCTTHPRIVEGKPTKNVRYLQMRPDLKFPLKRYVAEVGTRLARKIPKSQPLQFPVNSILIGRRNNCADREIGIKALSVYNPVHYQDLPELMMDFISSLSGKSPSTTGFGSEGALTKGPFNMLPLIIDLNNALVSQILTEDGVFSTAAGFVGSDIQVDHDITFLIPELWSRMNDEERTAKYLIDNDFLEPIKDFEYEGRKILASRLGYRISAKFVRHFMGKIFASPAVVFDEAILKPETQNLQDFAEGVEHIVQSQNTVANYYFQDGTVELACPPLKALLHIMVHGNYLGMTIDSPEFRKMFTKESMLASDWYQARLTHKQGLDIRYWEAQIQELTQKMDSNNVSDNKRALYKESLQKSQAQLVHVKSDTYLQWLQGTIGADPFYNLP